MLSIWFLLTSGLAFILLSYIIAYFSQHKSLRNIPAASPLAICSRLWLLYQSRSGRRYLKVHEAHERLGTVVRLQPNHISIASLDAIPVIYGHGSGFLKSDFYDAFVTVSPGLFSTRDREAHTRKRKIISHSFSARSVTQFEQYMHSNIDEFTKQWDLLCQKVQESKSDNSQGYARLDCCKWFNYLTFDTIGDLAFGAPFGMLKAGGKDTVEIMERPGARPKLVNAIESFNKRGAAYAAIGCFPALKTYAPWSPDPFFRNGVNAGKEVAGIGILRVNERLSASAEEKGSRVDILARLMEGKDEHGQPLGRDELTGEAMTQLVAGSDTTSNTLGPLMYRILKTPGVLSKLREEIDAVIPTPDSSIAFEAIKNLPYLRATINESLRIHPTNSLGLPRVVPINGPGVTICNHFFPAGTVLSVPTWTIHHTASIWGPNVEEFVPERWYPDTLTEMQKKAFMAWGIGPRQCTGRNVGEMEVMLIIATIVRRYEFVLYDQVLVTSEGFLNKPVKCDIGVRWRVG